MRSGLIAAVLTAAIAVPIWCQAPAKSWKDRAEFDLCDRITREPDPGEKLKLLLDWRRLYPATDFARERQSMFLRAYDEAGQGDQAFEAARELLETDSSNLMAMLVLCRWAPTLKKPPEGAAGLVKKAAAELLTRLDQALSTTRREMTSFFEGIDTGQPARTEQVPDKARPEQRARAEQVARQALEWASAR